LSPILGIWASQNYPRITNSYESISTVSVGSGGTSTITFSSIPSTYKHLQLRSIARGPNGDVQTTFLVRFNSDSGNNYSYHRFMSDGSSASSTGLGSYNSMALYWGASGTTTGSNVFGASVLDLLDYQNTSKNKTVRFLGGTDNNGSGGLGLGSGAWYNTSAVSTLTIIADGGGNFAQYSQFALYGIRG